MTRLRVVQGGKQSRPFAHRLQYIGMWAAQVKSSAMPGKTYTMTVNPENFHPTCNCPIVLGYSDHYATDCKHCRSILKGLARRLQRIAREIRPGDRGSLEVAI